MSKARTEGAHTRAVSSVVSAVLLMAMTVTSAVLFYAYSAGLMGSLLPPAEQQGSENPVIENIAFSPNGTAQITVRNLGSADSKVSSIYVDNDLKYSNPEGALIPAGQARTFTIPAVSLTQHSFKVATLDGSGALVYGPEVIFVVGTATITTSSGTGMITYTTTSTLTYAYTTSTWTSTTTYTTSTWTSTTTGTTTMMTTRTTTITTNSSCRICV